MAKIEFEISKKDISELTTLWKEWIQDENEIIGKISENNGSFINEPIIGMQDGVYEYITHSSKGHYIFYPEEGVLIFSGRRNSLGKTDYFTISRNGDSENCWLVTNANIQDEKGNWVSKGSIELKIRQIQTSTPEIPIIF